MYLKWVRNKYKEDDDNFETKPSTSIIKLPDGSLIMHPSVYNTIRNTEKIKEIC